MSNLDETSSRNPLSTGMIRALVGIVQGLALYLLFDAYQSKGWPSTDGPLFAALCATAIFVPLIVITGLTHLRLQSLAGWTLVVALLCAGLAYYDIVRDPISPPSALRNLPSPQLWFALSLGLFIAQSLLIAGAADRRVIARYPTYFDVSWKYGLQIMLAALFTGVFWQLLWLGAELFRLIKIEFLVRLIQKNWFWIPATTLALDYAVHITDVRVGIIRGVRTLSCNLLSWLLPLMTLIVTGFILSLPMTGLEPLWSTQHASLIFLAAAASLIFLINSAYQDGAQTGDRHAEPISWLLRTAMATAAAVLVPLVILAGYAILLRVRQYGWTPDRIFAAACTIVAACYAGGYAAAMLRGHLTSPRLELANVACAFVGLLTLLALFTPVADPARISVADQIRRLNAGMIEPGKFDYLFLRFSSGHYGTDALRTLAQQSGSAVVAEKAADILKRQTRYESQRALSQPTAQDRDANITVVQPPGGRLPPEFLQKDWSTFRRNYLLPSCITGRAKCDAVLIDIDGDGIAEIILFPFPATSATVFANSGQNSWSYAGSLSHMGCAGVREALLAGHFEVAPSIVKDLSVNGRRLRLNNLDVDCAADERSK
jgi:hypothetical protein